MQVPNRIVLCCKSLEYRREDTRSGRVVKKDTNLNAQVKQSGVIRQCRT